MGSTDEPPLSIQNWGDSLWKMSISMETLKMPTLGRGAALYSLSDMLVGNGWHVYVKPDKCNHLDH